MSVSLPRPGSYLGDKHGARSVMTLKVRGRHPDGSVSNILCDTPENARDILNELRSRNYTEAWVEDTEGRKIDEATLKRGAPAPLKRRG